MVLQEKLSKKSENTLNSVFLEWMITSLPNLYQMNIGSGLILWCNISDLDLFSQGHQALEKRPKNWNPDIIELKCSKCIDSNDPVLTFNLVQYSWLWPSFSRSLELSSWKRWVTNNGHSGFVVAIQSTVFNLAPYNFLTSSRSEFFQISPAEHQALGPLV